MTKQDFYARLPVVIEKIKFIAKTTAPVATGNLRDSIKQENKSTRVYTIYVDETQAPYMKYTNEPWTGRDSDNPNENWFDELAPRIIRILQDEFGGTAYSIPIEESDGE